MLVYFTKLILERGEVLEKPRAESRSQYLVNYRIVGARKCLGKHVVVDLPEVFSVQNYL